MKSKVKRKACRAQNVGTGRDFQQMRTLRKAGEQDRRWSSRRHTWGYASSVLTVTTSQEEAFATGPQRPEDRPDHVT